MPVLSLSLSLSLKLILPHHTFQRTISTFVVFRSGFFVVRIFDIPFDFEINQLADWHAAINPDWFDTGYFKRPGITISNIAFPGSGVNIYS